MQYPQTVCRIQLVYSPNRLRTSFKACRKKYDSVWTWLVSPYIKFLQKISYFCEYKNYSQSFWETWIGYYSFKLSTVSFFSLIWFLFFSRWHVVSLGDRNWYPVAVPCTLHSLGSVWGWQWGRIPEFDKPFRGIKMLEYFDTIFKRRLLLFKYYCIPSCLNQFSNCNFSLSKESGPCFKCWRSTFSMKDV